ncbi:MAG: glycosyltransferase family 2 protein [Lachnospiraceae bacterium]|jgi:hypothetical protein|nr:glycosyltransferase family 2 protein [Lachnospiraceae bacterium]
MKKTTVIIPNYNGMKYLPDCLAFLKRSRTYDPTRQTNELLLPGHEFDTIVVDNGSNDGSVAFLKREYPKVKVIALEENTGFSHAVNEGILAAQTPYVILLNNDTKVDTYFVSRLEQAIESRKRYFSIGAKMLDMNQPEVIDDAGDLYCALGWAFALGKGMESSRYDKECDVFAACAGAAIYRREIFKRIGLFDTAHFAYLEDIDIGYRARLYGYRNGFCPGALVYHAGSASSGSRYNAFKVKLTSKNSVYLIFKNMPFLQRLLNLPFLLPGFLIKFAFFVKKGYGFLYLKGLFAGLFFSFSEEGRQKRVPFSLKRFRFYCKIQLELWWNMLRRIIG